MLDFGFIFEDENGKNPKDTFKIFIKFDEKDPLLQEKQKFLKDKNFAVKKDQSFLITSSVDENGRFLDFVRLKVFDQNPK